MPLTQVKIIEGAYKQEIIERLTDAMVAIEGEEMRSATWCLVTRHRAPLERGRPRCRPL